MLLQGKKIFLRSAHPGDTDLLLGIENDPENQLPNSPNTYTRKEIESYLLSQKDIYLDKQWRLIVCEKESNTPAGCIDLYEYDQKTGSAFIGIMTIVNFRRKGYAADAIATLADHSFKILKLRSLKARIQTGHKMSETLFEKSGFTLRSKNSTVSVWELCPA